jgi:hypothetical protein
VPVEENRKENNKKLSLWTILVSRNSVFILMELEEENGENNTMRRTLQKLD